MSPSQCQKPVQFCALEACVLVLAQPGVFHGRELRLQLFTGLHFLCYVLCRLPRRHCLCFRTGFFGGCQTTGEHRCLPLCSLAGFHCRVPRALLSGERRPSAGVRQRVCLGADRINGNISTRAAPVAVAGYATDGTFASISGDVPSSASRCCDWHRGCVCVVALLRALLLVVVLLVVVFMAKSLMCATALTRHLLFSGTCNALCTR